MAVLRKFYLVYDQSQNCCANHFGKMVARVMEFLTAISPTIFDAKAGYIFIDNHEPIDPSFLDGWDGVWGLVEEKDFDESKLVKKDIPGACDKCIHRRASLLRGELPTE